MVAFNASMRSRPLLVAGIILALFALAACAGPQVSVSGHVLDAQGAPVSSVLVATGNQHVATDEAGLFQVLLRPGEQTLAISAPGYVSASHTVTVAKGAVPDEQRITLSPRTLAGAVSIQPSGAPIAGAPVTLGANKGATDDRGQFEMPAPVGAALTVTCHGCLDATLTAEQVEQAFDADGRLRAPLAIAVAPRTLSGRVLQAEGGGPVARARVTAGGLETTADDEGAYLLERIEIGDTLKAVAEGYLASEPTAYEGDAKLDFLLAPWRLHLTVREQVHDQPLDGVSIAGGGKQGTTDAAGLATLSVLPGQAITLTLAGYVTETLKVGEKTDQAVVMRPERLVARVTNGTTKAPLPDALVQVFRKGVAEPELVRTNAAGEMELVDSAGVERLLVKVPRYLRATAPITRPGVVDVALTPFEAHGIYIPFAQLSLRKRILELLDLAHSSGLSAVVLDVKGDESDIAWPSQNKVALEAKAYVPNMMSLQEFLGLCKERNLYVIARMVIFKDDNLARAHPEWAVTRANGAEYKDSGGSHWMDPFSEEVRQYNIALATEVAQMGFDEVQFDYVRFPTDGGTKGLVYRREYSMDSRISAISKFLADAHAATMRTPAFLSADVFGLRVVVTDRKCSLVDFCDDGTGQWLDDLAPHLDYISPMVYPDTFIPGNLGLANPYTNPYLTVYLSMRKALERTKTAVRPWISHYSPTWRGVSYTVAEYVAQRKAADDAGTDGWLYWNARGNYDPQTLRPDAYAVIPNLPSPPK